MVPGVTASFMATTSPRACAASTVVKPAAPTAAAKNANRVFSQPHPELLRTKMFRVTVAVRSRVKSRTRFHSELSANSQYKLLKRIRGFILNRAKSIGMIAPTKVTNMMRDAERMHAKALRTHCRTRGCRTAAVVLL